jgi:NHL repeat
VLSCLVAAAALAAAPAVAAPTHHIHTVAGGGAGGLGDGGLATDAELDSPSGIAATADGGYLIADTSQNRVRKVSPQGVITTVAGDGTGGTGGDGGPATAAQLNAPVGVAATADGGFLIAEESSQRVRRVLPDGTIVTAAGTGAGGFGGDGGPATAARLDEPEGIAPTADGGFLVADTGNHRVRKVSPDGTIVTVAGTGGFGGFGGDGGAATGAQLNRPTGVAVTADGGFLIADEANQRVRRVAPDGTIATVAGTGTPGSAGDGGPATAAQLSFPTGVAATAGGGFVVSEYGGERVRRVLPNGLIVTAAGTGTAGTTGDGGPATAAQLSGPFAVAMTAGGDLLIADSASGRVRRVDLDVRAAPQGPAGGSGAAGPPGPPGPVGAPGPRGAPLTVDRLVVAAFAERLRARPGRIVRVRYFASAPADVELRVLEGRRTAGRARTGRNVLRVRAPRRPCRCRVVLTAEAGGQVATDRTVLVVRRARG